MESGILMVAFLSLQNLMMRTEMIGRNMATKMPGPPRNWVGIMVAVDSPRVTLWDGAATMRKRIMVTRPLAMAPFMPRALE